MTRPLRISVQALILTSIFGAMAHSQPAAAVVIAAVPFPTLVTQSSLIFHGSVVGKRSFRKDDSKHIYTDVSFKPLRIIKGQFTNDELVLKFLGGTLANGDSMVMMGYSIPDVGETGVYFIDETLQNAAQPFTGWDQGRFIVKGDAQNVPRIFTAASYPVLGFTTAGIGMQKISNGIAPGLIVHKMAEKAQLSLDDFVLLIEEMFKRESAGSSFTSDDMEVVGE